MTDAQRYKRLERIQLKVLFTVPFFAPGVAKLPGVFDSSIVPATACTDGKEIRWHPEFFDSQDDNVNVTILCHEVLHPLLGHLWRMPAGGCPLTWNEATDYRLNGMLRDFAKELTSKGLADPFPMPEGALVSDSFPDMSEEQVYNILALQKPPGGSGGGSGGGGCGPGGLIGGAGKPGPGQNGQPGQKPGSGQPAHGAGGSGKRSIGHFTPQGPGQPGAKEAKADWDGTFRQSFEAAKGRGNIPGSVIELLKEMLSPKVP